MTIEGFRTNNCFLRAPGGCNVTAMTGKSLTAASQARRRGKGRAALLAALVPALAALWLAGCSSSSAVVGASTTAGVAAYQERGITGRLKDLRVEAAIMEQWINFDHVLAIEIGIEVYEGRVLLTGAVEDPQMRAAAVRLAWAAVGVREIINEIQVVPGGGPLDLASDYWITAQLVSKITFDKEIMAINYSIETVRGNLYLIGIAQNQEELDRVIAHARAIKSVRRIISHVRIKGVK